MAVCTLKGLSEEGTVLMRFINPCHSGVNTYFYKTGNPEFEYFAQLYYRDGVQIVVSIFQNNTINSS